MRPLPNGSFPDSAWDVRRPVEGRSSGWDSASGPLVKYLKSRSNEDRRRAIEFLGLMRAKSRVLDIVRLYKHPDLETRAEVARSLGEIRDRRAILPLLAMAQNDDSPRCRELALSAIASFGPDGSEAIDAIFEMICTADRQKSGMRPFTEDSLLCPVLASLGPDSMDKFKVILGPKSTFSADTRKRALGTIFGMGVDPKSAAGRDLAKLLLSYIRSGNKDLAVAAAESVWRTDGLATNIKAELAQFGPTAGTILRNLIGASLWLSGVRDEKVLRMIVLGLSDDDTEAQEHTLMIIRDLHLASPEVTPRLLHLVKSSNANVRQSVIETMEVVGSFAVFGDELRRVIDNAKDEDIVQRARDALAKLEAHKSGPKK